MVSPEDGADACVRNLGPCIHRRIRLRATTVSYRRRIRQPRIQISKNTEIWGLKMWPWLWLRAPSRRCPRHGAGGTKSLHIWLPAPTGFARAFVPLIILDVGKRDLGRPLRSSSSWSVSRCGSGGTCNSH